MRDEALKLALEALKGSISVSMANIALRHEAITVIKEALAQPEHPAQMARLGWQYVECPACGSEGARAFPKPEEQPVAWLKTIETPGGFGKFVEAKPNEKGAKPVYLSPPAAPVQEPVAHLDGFWCVDLTCKKCYGADFRFKNTPPPAQRTLQGLTDEHVEMIAAWLETQMIETPTTGPHLANALRYVGAKLRSKNT